MADVKSLVFKTIVLLQGDSMPNTSYTLSTRPNEAIANANMLLRETQRDDEWHKLAKDELEQINKFIAEGQERSSATKDPDVVKHIRDLINKLLNARKRLSDALTDPKDDWSNTVIAAPVRLSYTSNSPKTKPRWSTPSLVVFAGLLFLCVIGFALLARMSKTPVIANQRNIEPTANHQPAIIAPTALPTSIAITPQSQAYLKTVEFNAIIRNQEQQGWTEVQFDQYKKSIEGLKADHWIGNIGDVKETVIGNRYYVEIDMPGTEDEVDVFLYVSKDLALSLHKGQNLTFSGIVDGLYPRFGNEWSVEIVDATLDNVPNITSQATIQYRPTVVTNKTVLSFVEIVRNPKIAGWTDVQFDQYKISITGLQAENWQGTVGDVKQSVIGSDYYAEVNMPGTSDETDVYLYITKDAALALRKGQSIQFTGIIEGLYPAIFEDWKIEVRAR